MSARPKLRSDLVVRKQSGVSDGYVMVKDPVAHSYLKFEAWEWDLLALMDGTRDEAEIVAAYDAKRPGLGVDAQWVADSIAGLGQSGVLEQSEQERHLRMMDKLEALRRRRLLAAETSTLTSVQFPLFDPDPIMDRVIPWIRWWWSWWFVGAWGVVFTVVLGFLIYHWDLYWSGFFALLDPSRNSGWDWVTLILLMVVVGIWHELGHGFTCKRFGGEVHDIGFMIMYFEPAFYCRIEDSFMFPRAGHRIWTVFGGPYFEMMLCSVAVGIWLWTPVEWTIHGLALSVVFISGLGVLFNLNPLLKLDGYYALMDWLDMPTLREDSFEYVGHLFKRRVLRLTVPDTPVPRQHRRLFLTYGLVAVTYTAVVLVVAVLIVRRWLVGSLGPLGYLVLVALLAWILRRRIVAAARFARHVWLDKRDLLLSRRGRLSGGVAAILALILLTVPRSATRVESTFVVEPGERDIVHASTAGVVRALRVSEGSRVAAGQVLALLESPELEAAERAAAADVARLRRAAAGARGAGDAVTAQERLAQVREAETRLSIARRDLAALALSARLAGIVSTPRVEDLLGTHLAEGAVLCTVDRLERVRLAIATAEHDIEELGPGVEVRMLAAAWPGRTLRSRVVALAAVADPPPLEEQVRLDLVQRVNVVRSRVEIDNPGGALRPGMSGRVQFLGPPRSVVGKLWRSLRRWAAAVFW